MTIRTVINVVNVNECNDACVCVQIVGMPCAAMVDTLADADEDRVKHRCEHLAEKGLLQCRKEIDEAVRHNSVSDMT